MPGTGVPPQGVEHRARVDSGSVLLVGFRPVVINSGQKGAEHISNLRFARGERNHGQSAHPNFSPNRRRSELRGQGRSGQNGTGHPTSFRVRFARTRRGFLPLSHPPISPEERFAKVVKVLLTNSKVTQSEKKGFGSSALTINGRIFATLNHEGKLLVKLPKLRVDALVASGKGERFDSGRGRLMKEWATIEPVSGDLWLPLAREALNFVASKG